MNHNHNVQEDFADMRTIRFWAVPPLVRRSSATDSRSNSPVQTFMRIRSATEESR